MIDWIVPTIFLFISGCVYLANYCYLFLNLRDRGSNDKHHISYIPLVGFSCFLLGIAASPLQVNLWHGLAILLDVGSMVMFSSVLSLGKKSHV